MLLFCTTLSHSLCISCVGFYLNAYDLESPCCFFDVDTLEGTDLIVSQLVINAHFRRNTEMWCKN